MKAAIRKYHIFMVSIAFVAIGMLGFTDIHAQEQLAP
jgi:hypothetical protein